MVPVPSFLFQFGPLLHVFLETIQYSCQINGFLAQQIQHLPATVAGDHRLGVLFGNLGICLDPEDLFDLFDAAHSADLRAAAGGTAKKAVEKQIKAAEELL